MRISIFEGRDIGGGGSSLLLPGAVCTRLVDPSTFAPFRRSMTPPVANNRSAASVPTELRNWSASTSTGRRPGIPSPNVASTGGNSSHFAPAPVPSRPPSTRRSKIIDRWPIGRRARKSSPRGMVSVLQGRSSVTRLRVLRGPRLAPRQRLPALDGRQSRQGVRCSTRFRQQRQELSPRLPICLAAARPARPPAQPALPDTRAAWRWLHVRRPSVAVFLGLWLRA